jgi:type IV secretion system protein VirB1
MIYDAAAIMVLASQCAPSVAPQTVAAVVRTESHGQQFAIGVNGVARQPAPQGNAADAAATARRYINAGYSVDLGLGQINSRNLRAVGQSLETIFDPCTNLAALAQILSANYTSVRPGRQPQDALRMALSMYNTGSTSRGFANGYVGRVVGNAGFAPSVIPVVAAISMPEPADSGPDPRQLDPRNSIMAENQADAPATQRPTPPPSWNVFERAAYERRTREIETSQKGSEL